MSSTQEVRPTRRDTQLEGRLEITPECNTLQLSPNTKNGSSISPVATHSYSVPKLNKRARNVKLSVAMRQSLLAKVGSLVSQFALVVDELASTSALLDVMNESEAAFCLADMKGEIINLTTLERKIHEHVDFAKTHRSHELGQGTEMIQRKTREHTLLYLEETTNGTTIEAKLSRLKSVLSQKTNDKTKKHLSPEAGIKLQRYKIKEKMANYRMVLTKAYNDHEHLFQEFLIMNQYFFGLNDKKNIANIKILSPNPIKISKQSPKMKSPRNRIALNSSASYDNCKSPISWRVMSWSHASELSHHKYEEMSPLKERPKIGDHFDAGGSTGALSSGTAGVYHEANSSEITPTAEQCQAIKQMHGVRIIGNSMNWYRRGQRKSDFSSVTGQTNAVGEGAIHSPSIYNLIHLRGQRAECPTSSSYGLLSDTCASSLPSDDSGSPPRKAQSEMSPLCRRQLRKTL